MASFVRCFVSFKIKDDPAALGYTADISPDLPIPFNLIRCYNILYFIQLKLLKDTMTHKIMPLRYHL